MKKLSTGIFIVGLIVIFGSIFLNLQTKVKESKAKENFQRYLKISNDNKTSQKVAIKAGDEIALIEIEAVNISSVIVSGTEKEQIRYYVGHFENTPMPGEYGNFAISGHSSTVYNQVFNRVKDLAIGDEIKITTKSGVFTYKVTEMFTVEPTNISVLDQDIRLKEMTIVTCTKDGKERLITKAILE